MTSRKQTSTDAEQAWSYRTEVARRLNRGGVSAMPLKRLSAVSIIDDEEYENYDLDYVPPHRRLRVAAILAESGFRMSSGRTFEPPGGGGRVVFPKPGILGTDPSKPAAELLAQDDQVVLVTPSQAVLLYLHHFPSESAPNLAQELAALVWEQPANLDKVRDWARAAGQGRLFGRMRPRLEKAQAEGIELRRRRVFESRLPR